MIVESYYNFLICCVIVGWFSELSTCLQLFWIRTHHDHYSHCKGIPWTQSKEMTTQTSLQGLKAMLVQNYDPSTLNKKRFHRKWAPGLNIALYRVLVLYFPCLCCKFWEMCICHLQKYPEKKMDSCSICKEPLLCELAYIVNVSLTSFRNSKFSWMYGWLFDLRFNHWF